MICKYCGCEMCEDECGFINGAEYSIYICNGENCRWQCTTIEGYDEEWEEIE